LLENVGIGLGVGIAVGLAASVLLPSSGRVPARAAALCALGVGALAYGVATQIPHGNGLIAVFVGAITLGLRRPDLRDLVEHEAGGLVDIVKLAIFFVFGSLLTFHGLVGDGWGAVAVVAVTLVVARPVAVAIALARTSTSLGSRAFMAWFGPKGVATMTFSLLVLSDPRVLSRVEVFNLAAFVVFVSVIVHGLTDTPGVDWIARRQ
jgi:NhaP-type Na+/H+ or K+/H+ antiporter